MQNDAAHADGSRLGTARWLMRGWRPTAAQGRRLLASWVVGTVALGLTIKLLPDITSTAWWAVPLAVLAVGIVGAVLRPVLIALAVPLSWVGVFLLGLFSQTIVMDVALRLVPHIETNGFWSVFWAAWVYAVFTALLSWFTSVNEQDAFIAHCVRLSLRKRQPLADAEQEGVVFVQMDGMAMPILRWGIVAGTLPTLSRWVRGGSHRITGWTVRVPSTTPVSQAGFLFGRNDDMPAFRWYERDAGRLIVANHPADAALIESRLSTGQGLLMDGGASIGNLFSGDAPTSLMTMASMSKGTAGLGSTQNYAAFFAHPYGFVRALLLSIGEVVKERFQARRQRRVDLQPRVHRPGSYAVLRAATNVLMRDLQTSLIIDQMMRGTKSVFVDFLDYDEVAHHAGPAREESLRSLQGIDQVLGVLARVAERAPRRYHFVVVSDHGQSQGATFLQRYGVSLQDLVHELMGGHQDVVAATSSVEDFGPANTFVQGLSGDQSATGRMTRRVFRGRKKGDADAPLGPAAAERKAAAETPDLVVCGSGNLGLVWFARHHERLTRERMDELWPGLVDRLAAHPGVSFVVVLTSAHGAVAIGHEGVHYLDESRVEGVDPLLPFGPQARIDMRRCAHFSNAPDIYLNRLYDPELDEVAAFEELVGCHGGLGGAQTHAVLVYPSTWDCDRGALVGADAVHRQLVRWLEDLGHRRTVAPA
ncbi:MAG TPA: phage holin family protein [Candidatus Dormibacteraeota bacterium]